MYDSRSTKSARCLLSCVIALLIGGCSDGQRIGKYRYDVPTSYLVPNSSYPFFLPRSDDDGFIFILNPNARLPEQNSVLVEDRNSVCTRAKGGPAYVNSTICAPLEVEWKNRRWVRSGDETFWTYSPETRTGVPAPYVSCFKMQITGHPGLCHATLAHGDLAITIGFKDDELPALQSKYSQALAHLSEWAR
ncbi:MAG: hypothetical protein ACKOUT_03030 [Novosphingobium sp.]